MFHLTSLLLSAVFAVSACGSPLAAIPSSCPLVTGDINITNPELYPENGDWDPIHCKLYLSSNFNGTVLVYDPYTQTQEILTFPGITANSSYHLSGIDFDLHKGFVYFSANAGPPFATIGKDLSGPNILIKYDTTTKQVVYRADMADFQAQVQTISGSFVSGFQDMAEDEDGNSYFIASFGNAIAKVSPIGVVSVFYAPGTNSSLYGYTGIAATSSGTFVILDTQNYALRRFTIPPSSMVIQTVEVANMPIAGNATIQFDGAYLPPKYEGRVLLASDDYAGIRVFYSYDDWLSAKYLGTVPGLGGASSPTATIQIANSIYMNNEFFLDSGIYDTAGNRTVFPLTDITDAVDALVQK